MLGLRLMPAGSTSWSVLARLPDKHWWRGQSVCSLVPIQHAARRAPIAASCAKLYAFSMLISAAGPYKKSGDPILKSCDNCGPVIGPGACSLTEVNGVTW